MASVAGLLGAAYPHLLVHDQASDGARFDAVPAQLAATAEGQGYDVVLIQAGGNDVIRGTDAAVLAEVLEVSIGAAKAQLRPGGVAIVQPAGNVGNAAFFLPPLSQLMSQRARELHSAVRSVAARHGVVFVNLYQGSRAGPPLCSAPDYTRRMACTPAMPATAFGTTNCWRRPTWQRDWHRHDDAPGICRRRAGGWTRLRRR